MKRFLLLALLPLAACATPQERCISAATKDIRVLNKLIAVSQGNLNRGYAIEREEHIVFEREVCGEVDGQKVYCEVPTTEERKVPVSIDLNAERAKLASLIAKRDELEIRAVDAIAQCQDLYPET